MFRWAYLPGALVSCAATLAVAQTPVRPTDPVFVRAQGLVSDGNGAAGRALIDSVIAATSPTGMPRNSTGAPGASPRTESLKTS